MLWERLSGVETAVCTELCDGNGPTAIAGRMGIPWGTLKGILTRIYAKCEISGGTGERIKAVRLAVALTYDRDPALRPTGTGFHADLAISARLTRRGRESLDGLRVRRKNSKASPQVPRTDREPLRARGQEIR